MDDHSDWINGAKRKSAASHVPLPSPQADPLRETEGWAATALERECDAVRLAPEGTRNHTLNTAAFNLGQIIAAGYLDEVDVRTRLSEAAYACGLDFAETLATINSGLAAGFEEPRGPRERQNGDLSPEQGEPTPGPQPIDWGALWADPGVLEWLCEPVLPAGRLVALYSPPKVGKSLLALEMSLAISRGTRLLGVQCKQVTVMYLDYENAELDIRDRLQAMGAGLGDLGNLRYFPFPDLPKLDTPAGGMALLALAHEYSAGLVVIDTISRAIAGEENEASTWNRLYQCTLQHLKAAGIAVLRLDHTGKDEGRGQRGSSAKSSDVDLVWRLEEMARGDTYLLRCEAHRIQMRETLLHIERRNNPLGHWIDTRSIGDAQKATVLRVLDEAELPTDAGRDRARAVLKKAGVKIRDATLSAILRERQGLEED